MSGIQSGTISRGLGSVLVVGLLLGACLGPAVADDTPNEADAIRQAKSLSTAFRAASKKVLPTVVKIRTVTQPPSPRKSDAPSLPIPHRNPFEGTPWEDFFGDEMPGFRRLPDRPQPGLGSGVIIDPSGVVLTNNHVVAGADTVVVQLGDGRKFEAIDIKTDKKTDLAVVRIKADGSLPAAQLGNSDELEIGDWVLAIGNPFELEQTVSAGIISAKGRSLGLVGRSNFLQTDAAINPGNSGGPLVNLDGQVVGISTAIASRNGGYQGIGFAIPVNIAKWVTPQLIERGSVQRAYLGVQIGEVTADEAERLEVRPHQGVVVGAVSPDSPAEKAELRQDDVILSYDSQPIRGVNDLQVAVERSAAKSRHRLEILREGKPKTLHVTVEAMPDDFDVASFGGEELGTNGMQEIYQNGSLGLAVIDLPEALAKQMGLDETAGALLVHVNRQGLAHMAGLREGMVIVRIGDKAVKNVGEFRAALKDQSLQNGITFEVRTEKGSQTVTLQSS